MNFRDFPGCICVAITDYRNCSKKKFNFSGRKDDLTACNDSSKEFESFKVLLKPTYASLLLDQKLIQTSFQFDDDFMLDLESKYLVRRAFIIISYIHNHFSGFYGD